MLMHRSTGIGLGWRRVGPWNPFCQVETKRTKNKKEYNKIDNTRVYVENTQKEKSTVKWEIFHYWRDLRWRLQWRCLIIVCWMYQRTWKTLGREKNHSKGKIFNYWGDLHWRLQWRCLVIGFWMYQMIMVMIMIITTWCSLFDCIPF